MCDITLRGIARFVVCHRVGYCNCCTGCGSYLRYLFRALGSAFPPSPSHKKSQIYSSLPTPPKIPNVFLPSHPTKNPKFIPPPPPIPIRFRTLTYPVGIGPRRTTAGWLAEWRQEEELKDAILLVFANKQDQQGSLSSTEVMQKMSTNGR